MRIDAHQHFWRYNDVDYGWIDAAWPIRRDYLPEHLRPHLTAHDIDGCIAVQARQTSAESDVLLQLADDNEIIAGVVGWVDLRAPNVEAELERLASHPKFVGVRHIVQDEPDDRFLLQPEFMRGVRLLRKYDLCYEVLVYPRQLPAAIEFATALSEQPLVLDHIAKPRVTEGALEPWAAEIRALARLPNVSCKVSGMITEADWNHWSTADFAPYLDVVLQAFGPERLLYGSDWPVCLLAGEYDQVIALAEDFARQLSEAERAAFFGETARRVYRC